MKMRKRKFPESPRSDHLSACGDILFLPGTGRRGLCKSWSTVKKGQVIGIVEAMKLMNEIESEYDGIVEEILVKNEETVEYGQPLFRIR